MGIRAVGVIEIGQPELFIMLEHHLKGILTGARVVNVEIKLCGADEKALVVSFEKNEAQRDTQGKEP